LFLLLALVCTALLKAALIATRFVALWTSAPAAFAGVFGAITEAAACTAKTTTFVAVVKTTWAWAITALLTAITTSVATTVTTTVTTSVITSVIPTVTKARTATKAWAALDLESLPT
jgi:hypothetical protein